MVDIEHNFHLAIREMNTNQLVNLMEGYNRLIIEHNKVVCDECICPRFSKYWEQEERKKKHERKQTCRNATNRNDSFSF